jgi:inversin
LQLLLENNADPALRDKDGLTPCMWACRMDNIKHFELLCRCDYTITEHDNIERDGIGRTWMHWAVRRTEPLECLQVCLFAYEEKKLTCIACILSFISL